MCEKNEICLNEAESQMKSNFQTFYNYNCKIIKYKFYTRFKVYSKNTDRNKK